MPVNNNGTGSSTYVMEMPSRMHSPSSSTKDKPVSPSDHYPTSSLPPPTTATVQLQKWNSPRINVYRVLATFYSFIILGANDAAYGALIPYISEYYNINYTIISLVFLSPIVGYTSSALTNNMIHMKFGQRGVAFLMSISHVIAYTAISLHPPYPVLVVVFIIAGVGNGLGDSGWNAWIGDMANANEVLGFLHGFYGLGAAISPLVATAVVTQSGWKWYQFYYLMIGAAGLEVFLLTATFWKADAQAFREEHPHTIDTSGVATANETDVQLIHNQSSPAHKKRSVISKLNPFNNPNSRTAEAVKHRATILAAIFLLIYVGIEVSISGWIVSFMLQVRGASAFTSGVTSTGFWLGVTVGRLVLGFVTARVFKSEKLAVTVYLGLCVALQLMFWLIPQLVVSAVMVSLLGFFLAPLFPAAVVVLTKLLPKRLHVAAVGFAAAMGASGACALPFAVGAIANARGVQVLQPIILATLVACLAVWLMIPKLPKQRQT